MDDINHKKDVVLHDRLQYITLNEAAASLLGHLIMDQVSDAVRKEIFEKTKDCILSMQDGKLFKLGEEAEGSVETERQKHSLAKIAPTDSSTLFIKKCS